MASTDASIFKLDLKAGFHRESTRYAEEGRWWDGDKVRFREGRPENIRGWVKKSATQYDGTARDLLVYSDNNAQPLAVWGTEKKLYVYLNGSITDITPIVSTATLTSAFNTSVGDYLVRVSSATHGRSVGDFIEISSTTTIGGNIVLSSVGFGGPTYEIVSVSGLHEFFISVASAASATEVSAGSGTGSFLLVSQDSDSITGLGFGAGVYNAGTSTTGERAWNSPSVSSAITFLGNQWSLDNYGEDVLACRRGGRIYYWDRGAAATPERSTVVTASPSVNDFILVSPNDRHVISLGCTGAAAAYSPLRVRWSDQNDYNNWTPSVSTTSGELDLTDGTRLIGGVRSRNQMNLWTDKSMYGMSYVGNPYTFQIRQLGTNCGLVGPHAAVDYDGRAFWMSDDNFYVFDGQVRNLRSSIRRYVYGDINKSQFDKVFAGVNSEFKEIIWLYPSSDGSECDSYAIFNPEEGYWVYGTTKWTTFRDRNVFDSTMTTGSDSYIYDNEPDGVYTGDGAAISAYIESADFDFADGLDIMFVDKIIPDFTINDGNLCMTLTTKQYPTGPDTVKGPYIINSSTRKIDLRARGRQARVRVSSNSGGINWRWGAVRLSGQKDGMR
jgi:hypothetical protein